MSKAIEIVKRFLQAENARDWTRWSGFLHADVQYEVTGSPGCVNGKAAYTSHMREVYARLPDWKFEITTILADGETVMVEFDGAGHYSGPHEGEFHEGVPLRLHAVNVFKLTDSQIIHVREYWDPAGYDRQLKKARESRQTAAKGKRAF